MALSNSIGSGAYALTLALTSALPLVILAGMFWDWETVVKAYSSPMDGMGVFTLYVLLPLACLSLVSMTCVGLRNAVVAWLTDEK